MASHRRLIGATLFTLGLVALSATGRAQSQPPAPASNELARRLVADPKFRGTVAAFDRDFDRFVAELIKLTEIPAPPFGEGPRAQAYLAMLKDAGLADVQQDAEGNVMGLWRGKAGSVTPLLAVAAHLAAELRQLSRNPPTARRLRVRP